MKPIHLLICLSLFVFATCLNSSVMANDRFEPSYNEMLKEHVRPQKAINGIIYNGVDYRAWKQDPRYPQVMKRLSDFNPNILRTESEKLAFWKRFSETILCGNPSGKRHFFEKEMPLKETFWEFKIFWGEDFLMK